MCITENLHKKKKKILFNIVNGISICLSNSYFTVDKLALSSWNLPDICFKYKMSIILLLFQFLDVELGFSCLFKHSFKLIYVMAEHVDTETIRKWLIIIYFRHCKTMLRQSAHQFSHLKWRKLRRNKPIIDTCIK